jgi:hypothetical protein
VSNSLMIWPHIFGQNIIYDITFSFISIIKFENVKINIVI